MLSLIHILQDRFALKLLSFVTTGYYLLINVGTVFALRQNPDVSRLLANGNPELTGPLASPFTGGYQHIYSLTMFTVAIVGIIWYYRPKLFETIGWGLTVLLGLLVIVMSNYSFAILFVFSFCLLVLCRLPKSGGVTTAILLACCLAALVVVPNLYRIFYFIAENTDSLKMQLRFMEVGNLLSGSGITEGSDAGTRIDLYMTSIKTFLTAPLFGIGDLVLKTVENPREIVGGHSIVCDYLAYYGLVGSILFHKMCIRDRYKDEDRLLENAQDADKTYVEQVLPGKMEYNLKSILEFSLWKDFKTMIDTVVAVVR